jgi:hypothetical protein
MSETLETLREVESRFRANLPKSVEVAALGVTSKSPFLFLSLRESLIWRTEELLRNACDALERKDLSVAGLLARALIENTALLSRLVDIFDSKDHLNPDELHDKLLQMGFGSKEWSDFPQAISILTCLQHVDKKSPGHGRSS